ncbi:MAG: hypothetical protein LAO51_20115 [Acidobacteriia bacterium]|nr:hypothetical protein [Terriglobia bacterium]
MILSAPTWNRPAARSAILGALAALAILAFVEATGVAHGWAFSWARELSCALLILFAAWSVGGWLSRRLLGRDAAGRAGHVVATALGLGVLALATFAAGVAGMLRPPVLWLLVAAASSPAAAAWRERRRAGPAPAGPAPDEGVPRSRWPAWPGRVAAAPVFLVGFLYASLPPTFYDTLVYHLGLPSLYLATKSLTYWNGSYLACYPQNAEMLNVVAMALGGEKAAQILSFGLACLLAAAVARMARGEAGREGSDLALLLLASQWPFWFEACFAKNDLLGALFLLPALSLVLERAPARPLRTLALAGVLAGLGVGVKLTNALPALLIGCVPALQRGRASRERMLRPAVFLLAVLAAASPWLVRNAVHRGNPFFPAFYSVLGGRDFSSEAAERMKRDTLQEMDRSPVAVAVRIAGIGIDRTRYASGGELTPLTIPLLAVGLLLSRRRETAIPLGIALVTLVVGVGYVSAVVRVYAVAWALVPLAAAAAFARFHHRAWRIAVVSIVVAGAAPGFLLSARMLETVSTGGSRVFLGRIEPEAYLLERVNYLPVARYANERLPADARILVVGSSRTAYFHRRCDAPCAWDDAWIARASRPDADPLALRDDLRRMGYTHVLLNARELGESETARRAAGILNDAKAADRLDRFFQALRPVARAGGCVLFEIPGR